jgi:hypothetical protein
VSDARLQQWQTLTRELLAAPESEGLLRSRTLLERRAELVASLRAAPPAQPVSAELAAELRGLEGMLQERLARLLEQLRAELAAVRRVREAVRGYQLQRPHLPALVSRQV